MSAGTRLFLADAQAAAEEIVDLLGPSCELLTIAGSIRRRRPDVGDIELVAIPRFRAEGSGLWDVVGVSLLKERLDYLAALGRLDRLSGGDRYVKLRDLASGMQVDLFIAAPENYGLILLIRTGPADYSQWLVTYARRRGYHSAGGSLRQGLCTAGDACRCPIIPTPTEESVYAALGLPYDEPEHRGVA